MVSLKYKTGSSILHGAAVVNRCSAHHGPAWGCRRQSLQRSSWACMGLPSPIVAALIMSLHGAAVINRCSAQ
jgi:hypothetical protein